MIPQRSRQFGEVVIHYPFRPNGEQVEYDLATVKPADQNPKSYTGFVTPCQHLQPPAGYGQHSIAVYEPNGHYRWLSFVSTKARAKWLHATAAKNDRLLRVANKSNVELAEKIQAVIN